MQRLTGIKTKSELTWDESKATSDFAGTQRGGRSNNAWQISDDTRIDMRELNMQGLRHVASHGGEVIIDRG
jgi:hypothetical protein